MKRLIPTLFVWVVIACSSILVGQDLRIASYNLNGNPEDAAGQVQLEVILAGMGNKEVFGVLNRVDLMAFQEGPTDDADMALLENAFENVFGEDYDVIYTDVDSFGFRTGFVFNTNVLALDESQTLVFDRNQMMAKFSLVNGDSNDTFRIFSCHFAEGDTAADETSRQFDALNLDQYYTSLGLFGTNYISVGTFGLESNLEDAFFWLTRANQDDALLLSPTLEQAIWSGNEAYLPFHNSTALGMNKRSDFFVISYWLYDDSDMEFTEGSQTIMGNNGSHLLGNSLTTGNGDLAIQSSLASFSDHLPLITDYQFNVVDDPVNDFYVRFATASYIVQPSGPRTDAGGSQFFNIEGDGNGQFASFGVLDFELSGELNDLETMFHTEDFAIVLAQANAGFTQNGPYSVYLCSPTATAFPIDSSIQYQTGFNGIACVPSILANGASRIATYPGIHRFPDGSLYPYRSGVQIECRGDQIGNAIKDAANQNGSIRFLLVPLTDATACTFAGFQHAGTADKPRGFFASDIESVLNPATFEMPNGVVLRGTIDDLTGSENVKMVLRNNSTLSFEVSAESRSFPREYLKLKFEASVRSSKPVAQTIEFFNYETGEYELVSDELARELGDQVINVEISDDPSRFHDFPAGEMKARITFEKLGFARGVTAFIDHIEWRVR